MSQLEAALSASVPSVLGQKPWRLVWTHENSPISHARRMMLDENVGSVLVRRVNDCQTEEFGIYTEFDYTLDQAFGKSSDSLVGSSAVFKLRTVSIEGTAMDLARAHQPRIGSRYVVITDGDEPVAVSSSRGLLQFLSDEASDDDFFRMPCSDLLEDDQLQEERRNLIVRSDDTVRDLLNVLGRRHGNGVRVFSRGELIGIVTDRDILRCEALDMDALVSTLITRPPVLMSISDSIGDVLLQSLIGHYRHIPVGKKGVSMLVHRDVLVGMVREFGDLIRATAGDGEASQLV